MIKMNNENIEKAIREGRAIAEKIKNAESVSDIDALDKEIEQYCDFVDENFGEPSDLDGEKECDLSAALYMAAEEKARQLEYYPGKDEAGNEDVVYFEKMLDAQSWVKNNAE